MTFPYPLPFPIGSNMNPGFTASLVTSVLLSDGWHTIVAGSMTLNAPTVPPSFTFVSASTKATVWALWPPLAVQYPTAK
jgi:hypothetical protein